MVLAEFKELKEENVVYKLVGPILAKQELGECRSNVEKRVEFIDKEIARQDSLEVDFQEKITDRTNKIKKMQADFQMIINSAQQQQAQMQAQQSAAPGGIQQ